MARQNKATVQDESLGSAFAQGLNEGMRLTGYVTVFIEIGDRSFTRKPMVAVTEVPDTIAEFLGTLRAEDYQAGVSIRLLAETGAPPVEEPTELDDGVEDAQVVEE